MTMDKVQSFSGSYEDKAENTANVTEKIHASTRSSAYPGGQLIPGILDDFTLNIISPKLSFADLYLLSSVSPDWAQAIESRLVYKARVQAQSRETFVVVLHTKCFGHSRGLHSMGRRFVMVLSLYSMRDNSWHELPPAPGIGQELRRSFQCVSLDGKIYVLGGHIRGGGWGSKEVYMLDPLGASQWKQCASMLEPRGTFGATVRDGKIYAFGGANPWIQPNCGCEVYDPKADAWSWVKPMLSWCQGHQVTAVADELFVHGGLLDEEGRAQVYHPVEDKWRLMETFGTNRSVWPIFSAKGTFLTLKRDPLGISTLDTNKQCWTHFQSCTFPDITPTGYIILRKILAVDDEFIAMVSWCERTNQPQFLPLTDSALLRSRGFGQKHTEIVWERIRPPHDCRTCLYLQTFSFLCCLQI